jgi:hypothetical protein
MRGSGKTQLVLRMLLDKRAYRGHYHMIYLISPTFIYQYNVWNAIAPKGFKVYAEAVSDQVIDSITTDIQKQPHPCRSLIIFDDNSDMLHSQGRDSNLKTLVNNGRHLGGGQNMGGGVSLWFLCQKMTQVPTWIRSQSSAVLSASSLALREREIFFSECSVLPKKEFMAMLSAATERQFTFMACVFVKGKLRYFKIRAKSNSIEWEDL